MESKIIKRSPILYMREEECCGCSACYAICPQSAIVMVENREGFLYPCIKTEICIGCNQCKRVCPLKN